MEQLEDIVGLKIATAVPTDVILKQILDADRHNLPPIYTCTDWRERRAIALIGGGPSLKDTLAQALNYDYIMICGSAHDYVMSIYKPGPHQKVYAMVCDPDPIMAGYLQKHDPDVTYLLASQCHSDVFELLSDRKCYLWHALGEETLDIHGKDRSVIRGGATVGTRAIVAAMNLGFFHVHLFGFDSCLTKTYKHHAYDFNNPEVESVGNISEIYIDDPATSPKFIVAGYMLAQAIDFQQVIQAYYTKLDIKIFGGGLLAYFMETAHKKAIKLEKEKLNGTCN